MKAEDLSNDLEQLAVAVGRNHRHAAHLADSDPELAAAYQRDGIDLWRVHRVAISGDLAEAGRIAYDLDTLVRDQIPRRLFNALMKANGTNA